MNKDLKFLPIWPIIAWAKAGKKMLANFIFSKFFCYFRPALFNFSFVGCLFLKLWIFSERESVLLSFCRVWLALCIFLGWIGSTKISDLDGLAALGRTEKGDDGGAARWRASEFEKEKIFCLTGTRREEDHKSKQTRRLWPASKASSRHWEIGRRSGVGNALQNKKSMSKGTRWGASGLTDVENSSSWLYFDFFFQETWNLAKLKSRRRICFSEIFPIFTFRSFWKINTWWRNIWGWKMTDFNRLKTEYL